MNANELAALLIRDFGASRQTPLLLKVPTGHHQMCHAVCLPSEQKVGLQLAGRNRSIQVDAITCLEMMRGWKPDEPQVSEHTKGRDAELQLIVGWLRKVMAERKITRQLSGPDESMLRAIEQKHHRVGR